MLQDYRDDNEDVGFKFFHVFKRIETCDKWILTRAALAKAKESGFDPIVPTLAAVEGGPSGTRRRRQRETSVQPQNDCKLPSTSASLMPP